MRRRDVLVLLGSAAASPLSARAQEPRKIYRIGILGLLKRPSEDAFRDAMRDLGYVEGKNLVYEARYAEGHADRLPALAIELIHLKVDVIVTAGALAAEAAKEATTAVPIVLWGVGDPIGIGLVTDVSHPGGNITGVTELSTELTAKRLQLFMEVIPSLKRIAVIWNSGDNAMSLRFREVEAAAPGLGLSVMPLPVQALDDFDTNFEAMARDRPDGVLVVTDVLTRLKEGALFEFARSQRLPTMFEFPRSVHDGGLISYGPSIAELSTRAAAFVDKILKGAKPGDLPIESPVHWYLVINLRTARVIGVTISSTILARADEVIE
jgi:putative tryptophan/tyrosine transport system substrate-binding protein